MLFHTGVLWRLNELGILYRLKLVSSVSSGSIVAGILASNWENLDFRSGVAVNFEQEIVAPIRKLASLTIDLPSAVARTLGANNRLIEIYRKHLFGNKTLQDIPDAPSYVFNTTNLNTGSLWTFSKKCMGDVCSGEVNPTTELAVVVAASSAFPIIFSPVKLSISPESLESWNVGNKINSRDNKQIILVDGGLCDNLGLESVWSTNQTILVSDAIALFNDDLATSRNWVRKIVRIFSLINNQVRDLRKARLLEFYRTGKLKGAYWSISANLQTDYDLEDILDCPFEKTRELAKLSTRLKKVDLVMQKRIINWGYTVSDASIRQHLDRSLPPPTRFPYLDEK